MKKLFFMHIFAFVIAMQSCETKNELLLQDELDIEVLALKASKDIDFQNFITSNRKILNSIDEKIMKITQIEQ